MEEKDFQQSEAWEAAFSLFLTVFLTAASAWAGRALVVVR